MNHLSAADSEEALLGIILSDPSSHHEAQRLLSEEDFYVPAHRVLWGRIMELGAASSPEALVGSLTRRKELDAVGGALKVMDLYTGAGGKEHLAFHARELTDASTRRGITALIGQIAEQVEDGDMDPADIVSSGVAAMGMLGQGRGDLPDIRQLLLETVEAIEAEASGRVEQGLPLRWQGMTARVPMRKGSYVVVGGKTSSGKSVLSGNMVVDVVRGGMGAAVFSFEMSSDELLRRLLCDHARIAPEKLFQPRQHPMGHGDMAALSDAQLEFANANLHIFDDPNMGTDKIAATCRILHAKEPLALVVVDYIQLIPMTIKGANREVQVATISRNLRALALELGVCIVALTQLNENGDVRESRAIIQDAEILLSIDTDVIWVEKQRHGPRNFALNIELKQGTLAFKETTL